MSRRRFLQRASVLGAASLFGLPGESRAEPPPETRAIRLVSVPAICLAPQYLAEELLKAEGFTEISYAGLRRTMTEIVGSGEADLSMDFAGSILTRIDAGDPVVALSGVHLGCYQLFGSKRVRGIRDLKGKTVAVWALGTAEHIFLSSMAAYVGLDPRNDIRWFEGPAPDAIKLLEEDKIDAILAWPPEPQELQAKGIGHLVVNTATDHPWSQYFCCMIAGNREFVRRNPVATKRAVRAILKAADICAENPGRVARFIVDKHYAERIDYALQALQDVPYKAWRTYNPEDTLRFHALRLREVGMIKSSPQKLIEQGTDWRFLNELKKELKT